MIFCQMRRRFSVQVGRPVRLQDVADVRGDGVPALQLHCPDEPGVWIIRAVDVASALEQHIPGEQISLLGSDVCYVHRLPAHGERLKSLRVCAAFFILMLGSALGLCWFHSDVDMPGAQLRLFELLTGALPSDPAMITVPYIVGVVLGVVTFYALPGRKEITPMEVKLMDYQEDMERARGRDTHES